jgi:hypothetical protein
LAVLFCIHDMNPSTMVLRTFPGPCADHVLHGAATRPPWSVILTLPTGGGAGCLVPGVLPADAAGAGVAHSARHGGGSRRQRPAAACGDSAGSG